jgi:transposase
MCKTNFAATVNEKTPFDRLKNRHNDHKYAVTRCQRLRISLDTLLDVRHKYIYVLWRSMPMKSKSKPLKAETLRQEGTLNPTPERVRDPRFQGNEFFDPHDIVQVKYEMLRRVSVENASVSATTEDYGVSRPTYYQTKASFDKAGIAGLVPQKRGPRGPHKFRGEALAFVQQQLVAGEPVRARELAKLVRQRFDLNIHPRTIERAVAGKKTHR